MIVSDYFKQVARLGISYAYSQPIMFAINAIRRWSHWPTTSLAFRLFLLLCRGIANDDAGSAAEYGLRLRRGCGTARGRPSTFPASRNETHSKRTRGIFCEKSDSS
jgi:hypothetical protein